MTGRQVTMSSKSTHDSSRSADGLRKSSIQRDVSTRTTTTGPVDPLVLSHRRQLAMPETRPGKVQDATCFCSLHHFPQCALDSSRVRPPAAHATRLLEKITTQHKIRTFH